MFSLQIRGLMLLSAGQMVEQHMQGTAQLLLSELCCIYIQHLHQLISLGMIY